MPATCCWPEGSRSAAVAIGGAVAGAHLSSAVPEPVLLAAFSALMLVVAGLMTVRQLRGRRRSRGDHAAPVERPQLDDPIITFSPTFMCQCPRALKVVVTATVVGLLTGFLGVGGGFLVVPALVLALALPMRYAAGTSLVVITITSTAALAARAGVGVLPDWRLVATLTVTAVVGSVLGARLAARTDTTRLSAAFTGLVLAVAAYVAALALPALV